MSGYSAPKISDGRYLDVSGLSGYFAPVQNKAVAFFVLGQAVQKNPMFGVVDMSENFWCSFSVNGQTYEKLSKGVIAKLVLEPGRYTIYCSEDPGAQINTTTAILKPSSTTTFIADSTQTVKLAGREVTQSVRAISGSVPDDFKGRTPVSM